MTQLKGSALLKDHEPMKSFEAGSNGAATVFLLYKLFYSDINAIAGCSVIAIRTTRHP